MTIFERNKSINNPTTRQSEWPTRSAFSLRGTEPSRESDFALRIADTNLFAIVSIFAARVAFRGSTLAIAASPAAAVI